MAAACSGTDPEPGVLPVAPLPPDQDPGLLHVHGLGENPADGTVYAATHFGLWRVPGDGSAERVGNLAYDFMGFTVVGPDQFIGSGHPLLSEDVPPLLGLVETTDAGETWRSVSLMGDADFHVLRAAHDKVWGWNSHGSALMVSSDRREWETRAEVEALLDFVVDPADPENLLATISVDRDTALLQRSGDGGRTWENAAAPPLARLSWIAPDRLWGIDLVGAVWQSADGGATWGQLGSAPGFPEAFADTGRRLLVAAVGVIAESIDDGATWQDLHVRQSS